MTFPWKKMENSQLPTMFSSMDLAPSWVDLPHDITARILLKLGAIEIVTVAQNVCTTWRSVCRDPSMWRSIDMDDGYRAYDFYDPYDLDEICRHAVDLSQGQLADITIYPFCDDDLLIYISERCPRLRRLQLVRCNDLGDDSLSTALQNLPLLEELHIYYTRIYAGNVEMVGISCPLLKSFKLIHSLVMDSDTEQSFQTMPPKLRHLELIGNDISNKGLQAILDGCPHLETLDLRECYNLDFSGDIEKECSQRLEVLRRPDEASDECPFSAHRYRRRRSRSYDACSLMDDDLMYQRDEDLFMSSYYEDYLEFYEDPYDLDDDDEIYDKHRCQSRRSSTRHALKREAAKKRPQKRSSWTRRGCTGNWKSNGWYL